MNFREDKTSYEYKSKRLLKRMIDRAIKDVRAVFKFDPEKITYKLSYKDPCWSISFHCGMRDLELQVCCLNRKSNLESIYLDRVIDHDFHWDGLGDSYLDVRRFIEHSVFLMISDAPKIE